MTRALVVYCHPKRGSFTEAVRDVALDRLRVSGAETRVIDLYGDGFAPLLTAPEFEGYEASPANEGPVSDHVAALRWADTLIFVYPTWWYGLPAALKGWLDRVLLPGVAFLMPDATRKDIAPALTQIRRLAVFTTCGASWRLTTFIGSPGKRTILRGVRLLCHPRCRTAFAAHYSMDRSTKESRARHLARVALAADRLLRPHPLDGRAP